MSTIQGLSLDDGEFPIAVEKVGGKRFVITNRRSAIAGGPGKVKDLPHSELADFRLRGWGGPLLVVLSGGRFSRTTLELRPREGSSYRPLVFKFGFFESITHRRLKPFWGSLVFWVFSRKQSADNAPPVDGDGRLLSSAPGIDIAICRKSLYQGGFDLGAAFRNGATVLTPKRLFWLKKDEIGDRYVHASLPVEQFVIGLAQRSSSTEEFEEELERMSHDGLLADSHVHSWASAEGLSYSAMSGLRFKDQGKRVTIVVQGKTEKETVKSYLHRTGLVAA